MVSAAVALVVLAAIPTGTPVGAVRDRMAAGVDAPSLADDRARVEQTIRDSIGWAKSKDRALAESLLAHDESLFIYNPGSQPPDVGWSRFVSNFDFWLDPRFRATHFDVRDLRVNFSRRRDVAWFSAVLDDCYTWDGQPGCWKDTRWTGVLERRDGRWVIVQMHFSFAADPPRGGPALAE